MFKANSLDESKKILGKRGDKLYLIDLNDIYYIKADLDEVIKKINPETTLFVIVSLFYNQKIDNRSFYKTLHNL